MRRPLHLSDRHNGDPALLLGVVDEEGWNGRGASAVPRRVKPRRSPLSYRRA